MTIQTLLARLHDAGIRLRKSGDRLALSVDTRELDPSLLAGLRAHRAALLEMAGSHGAGWWSPPPVVTPAMLTLVELTQAQIDRVVEGVEGGAANVQDIYPLAPLQEGILFHHLLSTEGDPYLLPSVFRFADRERLDAFVGALQAVMDRHDVLRTAVVWEGLPEPVQVVWRRAPLPVERVELDPAAGDAAGQLREQPGPRHYRIDVRRAPLLRALFARDPSGDGWLLLLLHHHLVSDHTTLEVLQEEVRMHLLGLADQLPPALPFRNFVARARLGVSSAEHEAFFAAMLGDVDEPTAPFGLLDVRGDGSGIAEARLDVDAGLAVRLRERAHGLGVSAASVCHVAWAQVLARVSGRDDVVFGTVLFGRMRGGAGADRMVGPFINTLPVRIRVAEAGVEATVRRTHALLAELLRHEHASLVLAQRCSGVAAPAPLFSTLLNYRHGAGGEEARAAGAGGALEGIREIFAEERTNYPLALTVDDLGGGGFALTAQVHASLEPAGVCGWMHTALAGLVAALETAPRRPAGDVEVLPEAERRRVVEEWSRGEAARPAERCVHQLFEAQVERTPEAVAVVCGEASLSYRELDERADRLARRLRRLGVGPEVRVGLCLERGPETVVCALGVLKAGGAYVPLDPTHPAERTGYVLEDAGVAVLLTQAALAERFAAFAGEVVRVDGGPGHEGRGTEEPDGVEDAGAPPHARASARSRSASPENLAYVLYTSGSTGRPKGVLVEHRSLAAFLDAMRREPGIAAGDVLLAVTTLAFDIAALELFLPLVAGARLALAGRDTAADPRLLARALDEAGATVMQATPATWRMLLDAGWEGRPGLRALCGGEALPHALAERLLPRVGALWNLYGPTETTVWSTAQRVEQGGEAPPIGRPIAGTRVYVLDARGAPVPPGVPGELRIGGAGVARGYHGRPELTAGTFVPDPYAPEPGARAYRTGDRVRWLASGALEYLGRIDHQVKVRGFRIEPGEIEARLLEHPGVREAVVVARGAPGEGRLAAYVVGDADAEALRAHLRRSLPEYMVPGSFVLLDRLPLSPNGKLDRGALPAPEHGSAAGRYVALRTPAEEVLAGIWAEVLRLERVGVEESFFELGGHSLLAMRAVSRIRDVLAVDLPLRALFEAPSVAELAERVEEVRRAGLPVLPPVVPVERTDAPPLSFAQERLWFLDRLQPESAFYNVPTAVRLAGALDAGALERALGEIVRRHEALRTTFPERDGAPVQEIAPFFGFALPVEDLAGLGEPAREAEVRRRVAEDAARPFDLGAGPLFRVELLRLDEAEHVLLACMHHVVCDEWSVGVLFRELSALYAAYIRGEPSPLPEPAVQYADYAVWQRRVLRGEALERQVAYWRERLAGAPALLELPVDRPRPAVQAHRGAHERVELRRELLERLAALGRGEGATLFMTLLGAFQVLLSKYAASDDVVVGSPIAGRTRRETEGLIGFFVNTLVLRTDLAGGPSFRETLRRVRAATLGAYEHQEVPFERLVEELQPRRSLSHAPLFQVMFVLEGAGPVGGGLPGVEAREVGTESGTSRFDLTLGMAAHPGGLGAGLEYDTELFDRGTVRRMLEHLERVLEQVAADPDAPLAALELLGEAERRRVVEEWNRTEAEYPAGLCIHQLFEAQAERTPDAVAVVFEDASLTYRQLNERANRLAHHLRRRGVGPEARVGLCLERGLEMMVALLGVLKAGGAYVPLDPGHPAERLALVLADSGVAVLLAQDALRGALPARAGVEVVSVDAGWAEIARESAGNPRGGAAPANLAYVIYTSGSTGTPKGVMNAHGGVVNRLWWMQAAFGLGADDVVLQKTPFSFDVSVWELFWPLQQGARLVMARPEGHRDPAYLQEVIERRGITTLHFVPSMLQPFLEAADPERCRSLRRVVCSGEALPPALVERFHERFPAAVELHNLYGPTEAAVDVSWWPCGGRGPVEVVPIGRPIHNTRLYVLDAALRPAPVGVPGELFIGGVQVARGYLDRPELTAERFVPDPFAPASGARLFRTGDRARWRADGALEYLGRLDEQVKVRGFRIEPGEIEAVLRRHPAVDDCVVAAREDVPGDRRLVAYVVGGARADELREHLRRSLPEHMVPAAFVGLESLPLTASGKLDRRALPAPDYGSAAERYVAPRTPAEEVLAGIWAETLRLERVGAHDSFFELGGHSLLATRVMSRVRDVFGVELPLRALFEAPTVAGLAGRVEAARHAGAGSGAPPLVPLPRGGAPLPASFAQRRLWFIQQLEPRSGAYNMSHPLRLTGALDARALRRALSAVVGRHEALRTTLEERGGEPVQVIHPPAPVRVATVELRGLAAAARERESRRLAEAEARRPFDLARGPLLRTTLLRTGEEEAAVLFTLHHVVGDGWSLEVLAREVSALYSAELRGEDARLPELPVQYADYAAWQRGWLSGEVLEAQVGWWRAQLAGVPALLELPTDRPRPAIAGGAGASLGFVVEARTAERLRALSRREGATPFMTLLAAWQLLLARYAGQEEVLVGTPIAGRTRLETEGLIGFFVNTLVLRAGVRGEASFGELLGEVRERTLGAYEHQDLPFEKLVEELGVERSLAHTPLFQVMLILQNNEQGELRLGGAGAEALEGGATAAKFDLTLNLWEAGGEIRGGLDYRSELWEAATVRRMAGHYLAVLAGVAASPERRLSELELLGEAERRRVLEEWSHAGAGSPAGPCVHQLFEAQAERTPRAVALVSGEESLSYAELDRQANRLAHRLRSAGVGREARVGLCLERGPELLVAVLGVLKAGGTYVPLDPAYPRERLAFIVEDAGIGLVVAGPGLAGRLPPGAVVLPVPDREPGDSSQESDRAPEGGALPESLAYVLYTSGSTGRPKGVMVEHRSLTAFLHAMRREPGIRADDVLLAVTTIAFDIAGLELFLPLVVGARVVLADRAAAAEPRLLARALDEAGATMMQATPATWRMLLDAEWDGRPGLRALCGGEALPHGLAEGLLPRVGTLWNLYGPTETTIWSTAHPVGAGGGTPPIGRPIAGTRVYVLDAEGAPVPVGVPGELMIGGTGVARGYQGRPELTAERFRPDPFAPGAGARLYRTGDRVRWRAGGELEYLGRVDAQVKIRGFRIEPGEVESVLLEHPGVQAAAVLVRDDAASGVPGERRLVAYVVPAEEVGAGTPQAGFQREHVRQWEAIWGDAYGGAEAEEAPAFNVAGWNSSYTGEPIPAGEMREWVERTAERIRALRPRRVLEIGCGTGLLLFRIAPACEEYWGADIAAPAIAYLERRLALSPLPQVRLRERAADDFAGIPRGHFDLVIVNSVAQYFPDVDYLLRVLDGAVSALAPGGTVFLGDLRSLPHLEAFHASVEAAQAPDDLPAAAFRERVRGRVVREKELLLDPELFRALPRRLPRISSVEVRLKRGRHRNEMTRFRYDVLLRVESEAAAATPSWRRWDEGAGVRAVRRELEEAAPPVLGIARVPNPRVFGALALLDALRSDGEAGDAAALRAAAAEREAAGVDPDELVELGEALGYRAQARWSAGGTRGEYDVLLVRDGSDAVLVEPAATPLPWSAYANDPLARERSHRMVPELRSWLEERVPHYMVPSALVLLSALPLTPNGKLDRRALPAPEHGSAEERYVAPRTPAEEVLAGIWAEILRLERVGAHESFFELGGHSLLATRVMSRVRDVFGVELPLRALFEAPTVAGLAGRVEAARHAGAGSGAPPLVPLPRGGAPLPASFAQRRLWFIQQLEPRSGAYNMSHPLRLTGALDARALRRALSAVVGRHEALRTTLEERGGEPVQVIHPPAPVRVATVELRGLAAAARERESRRLAEAEARRPFDLARGPLLRTTLLRTGEEEAAALFTLHHVVGDGWSLEVLAREVSALYAAELRGEDARLPELPVQYADYAAWQRGWLSGEVLEAQVGWWRAELAGAPALLELPTDRPRPAIASGAGAWLPLRVGAETAAGLRALSRREGATPFMTLLAAWQLLLARYAGQEEVLVGTPIAGRTRLETEGLIGFFVNTLVLRAGVRGEASFGELLGEARERTLGAYEHQDLPFEKLVEELGVERSLAHTPLFQVMFVLQNNEQGELRLGGAGVEGLEGGAGAAKFDLTLSLCEAGGRSGAGWTTGASCGTPRRSGGCWSTSARCWSRSRPTPTGGARSSACSAPPSASGSCGSGTPPTPPFPAAPACTSWSRRRRAALPRRPPSATARARSATPRWTGPPTASPATCVPAASSPRPGWRSSWSPPRRRSSPCLRCSRPAAPTCRWTPAAPRTAWRTFWTMPARAWC